MVDRLEKVYIKYAKHQRIAEVLLKWVRPHIVNVIKHSIPENELKQILWECKTEIESLDREMNVAKELVEARKLNDGRQSKFVENIKEYREALELIP